MYPPIQDPSTQELRRQAGEVRDYLVEVRGGAPFLSAADSQLLIAWLESEVPMALIFAAIDRVSARRRKKRVRSRMTLKACKGEVRRALKKQSARNTAGVIPTEPAPRVEPIPTHSQALADLSIELRDKAVAPPLEGLWSSLLQRLEQLSRQAQSPEERITDALALARNFHRDAWDLMQPQHEALRAAARAELAHLEGAVSERVFMELLEEAARDQLRRQFPWVSADQLWDRLQP